jgi:hypothetical protein
MLIRSLVKPRDEECAPIRAGAGLVCGALCTESDLTDVGIERSPNSRAAPAILAVRPWGVAKALYDSLVGGAD